MPRNGSDSELEGVDDRYPIRGTFWLLRLGGLRKAQQSKRAMSQLHNLRLWIAILDYRKRFDQIAFIVVLAQSKFEIRNPKSLNYLIRSRQHIRRNRQADLLRGFEIDDELELRRLLHWQVGGLCTFQNLVDVNGGAPVLVSHVSCIGHQAASLYITLVLGTSLAVGSLPQVPQSVFR